MAADRAAYIERRNRIHQSEVVNTGDLHANAVAPYSHFIFISAHHLSEVHNVSLRQFGKRSVTDPVETAVLLLFRRVEGDQYERLWILCFQVGFSLLVECR